MSLGRNGITPKVSNENETELKEIKCDRSEGSAWTFNKLTQSVKEKYENMSKQSFLSKSMFFISEDNQADEDKEVKVVIPTVPLPVRTLQNQVEDFEECLKKYKKRQPKIFAAGHRLIAEAYELLSTPLSAEEITSLDRSLQSAINLVKPDIPSLLLIDAVCLEAKKAIGHSKKFEKYSGALLGLVGVVTIFVSTFVCPPVSLLGFGIFLGGAYLFNKGKQKSMASALDKMAQTTSRYFSR